MPGLVSLIIFIAVIVGSWYVFEKAGKPGWAVLIPIYNIYVVLQIIGRPWWWLLLLLVPLLNLIIAFVICIDLAKKFGKGVLFGIGCFFLGFIFIPILGFSDAQYQG